MGQRLPDLLPEPFIGNPRSKVLLLNLNPGFAEKDLEDFSDPLLRELLLRCIQEKDSEYPFYYLHPACNVGGATWWLKRLRPLMEALDATTGDRRKRLANCIAVHEYFPYHTKSYNHSQLTSVSLSYQVECIKTALASGSMVIGMRSKALWIKAIPELESSPQVAWCSNPQQPYISQGNLGERFEQLLEVLKPCVL